MPPSQAQATTTTELIEQARAGDRRALEVLLERYEPNIYRFGVRMCGDAQDARDVLQDTMLAAARTIREFRGASSLTTWLYSIARSYCIKKRRPGRSLPAEPASPERLLAHAERAAGERAPETPEEALVAQRARAALSSAIMALDPTYREVLLLRDAEGLSAAEVAKILDIGVPAVKSRLHRARRMVRDVVAPALGIGDEEPSARCPDILATYSAYLDKEIDADTCRAMQEHVASCERCRNVCDSLKETLALCRTLPTVEVPADVQKAVREALRRALDRV